MLVGLTCNDWWLDAKLAGPAHTADIVVFILLVLSTEGFTSPYFPFFIFLLLAAAIRWGWRATALTAALLTLLYLATGLFVASGAEVLEVERFVIRTGHLVMLSLVIIWFGVNQWRGGSPVRDKESFADPEVDESPLETSLRGAMRSLGARRGVLVWREQGNDFSEVFTATSEAAAISRAGSHSLDGVADRPFLYDRAKDRTLSRDDKRNLRASSFSTLIPPELGAAAGLHEGIAIPIHTGTGEGELFLEALPNLSADHIDFVHGVAIDVVAHIERHALLLAVEESAEARSRLALARDLHDSVVQFLAGAAFRLEALKRDLASGRDLEPEINHLKKLMLQEQGELRSFIEALRSAPQIGIEEFARDLRLLAGRLGRQWDVLCEFSAHTRDMVVPTRLQLDAQHLVREAVANAVRHAGAKTVTIRLRAEPDELMLDFINDGSRYPSSPLSGVMPRSLSERVKLAGGALELTRGMGVTKISVSLPIAGRGA